MEFNLIQKANQPICDWGDFLLKKRSFGASFLAFACP